MISRGGKIDTTDPVNSEYIKQGQAKALEKGAIDKKQQKAAKNGRKPSGPAQVDGLTKTHADIERVRTTTEKMRLEMAKKTGQLIESKLVSKMLSALPTVIISHFLPIGDRVTAAVSGVYESTDQARQLQVKSLIDQEVSKALKQFKAESEKIIQEIELDSQD